ncbi:uncharacterized protein LOC110823339 [Carica papaya]|uniref:uncharacterized protein LOC110823339 n=1 Tax=Carica papaya TaxID=3649 RepID=UPI000B8C9F94|nr:uncharacterized protein LOC110823339 [Carica papaya]
MFDSTLELITQAASNSLFVFCFFNLIIVIILAGSRPGSDVHQQTETLLPIGVYRNADDQKTNFNRNSVLVDVIEPVDEGEGNISDRSEDRDVEDDKIDEDDSGEGEEDALRRRIEEFIAKVNKEWKAEMLRTSRSA